MGRNFNHADQTEFFHIAGGYIFPCLTTVLGDMDKSVVRPGPDDPFLVGRFHGGEDGAVVFHACVVVGDGTAGRALFALVVCGEVWTDRRPALPFIGRLEQHIRRRVDSAYIVG